MADVVIIGSMEIVEPFKATGVQISEANTFEEAHRALTQAIENKARLIFLEERFFRADIEYISRFREKIFPTIIPIPGRGASGFGQERLRELIKRAVGADIF